MRCWWGVSSRFTSAAEDDGNDGKGGDRGPLGRRFNVRGFISRGGDDDGSCRDEVDCSVEGMAGASSGISCVATSLFICLREKVDSSKVCLELEAVGSSPSFFFSVRVCVRDPEASESELEGNDGDEGSAGLLSSLFISTTEATDVPPSDIYPVDE